MLWCCGDKIKIMWFLSCLVWWLKGLSLQTLAAGGHFWGPWPASLSRRCGEERTPACLLLLGLGDLVLQENLANQAACKTKPASCACAEATAWPQLHWWFSQVQGETSTRRAASFSPLQLVPLTAIWKYLSSCISAKEQLAYTLLLCYRAPWPSLLPNSSRQSPTNSSAPSSLACFYCLSISFPKSASSLEKYPSL